MSPDHVLEDNGSKFHLFLLVGSDPSPAHLICNFQYLFLLQQVKFIYGKWLKLIAITKVFKFMKNFKKLTVKYDFF
jgi:hypothetical protein